MTLKHQLIQITLTTKKANISVIRINEVKGSPLHLKDILFPFINIHKYFTDLQSVQQESLHLDGSAPVENVYVDKKAVDKLTEGFLTHYLPDLQNSKRALQELT